MKVIVDLFQGANNDPIEAIAKSKNYVAVLENSLKNEFCFSIVKATGCEYRQVDGTVQLVLTFHDSEVNETCWCTYEDIMAYKHGDKITLIGFEHYLLNGSLPEISIKNRLRLYETLLISLNSIKLRTVLLFLTGAILLVFLMGALQTIEYCVDRALPIPWQVYGFLIASVVWAIIASRVLRSDWQKVDGLLKRLLNE